MRIEYFVASSVGNVTFNAAPHLIKNQQARHQLRLKQKIY